MNTMLSIGQIVFSKCGRDRGTAFVITAIDGEYVFLVDGVLRKLAHPKKKKEKHVQKTNCIIEEIEKKIISHSYLTDADIYKVLVSYQNGLRISNKEVENIV